MRSMLYHAIGLMIMFLTGAGMIAPRSAAAAIVIGEFRLRGPNGGNDEFVELFNRGTVAVDLGGWRFKGSSAAGVVSVRATIAAGTVLGPGCRFLLANSGGSYSGATPADVTYGLGIADDGGVAITMADDTIVDQVGLSLGSAFGEGAPLAPLTLNQDRSYERRPAGGAGNDMDSGDNAHDFVLVAPSNPQGLVSGCWAATTSPSATPSRSVTATSTVSVTSTASPVATASNTPMALDTVTQTPTASVEPSVAATPTATISPPTSPTETPSETPTSPATATPSVTGTVTPTSTATASMPATTTPSMSPAPSGTEPVLPTPTSSPEESAGTPTASPTASPVAVCGNGVVEAGEHCDDGVSAGSAACPESCHFGQAGWLIRGNQRPLRANRERCAVAWQLRSGALRHDRFGMPDYRQQCYDQDPACDVDPEPGRCGFELRICRDADDRYLPICRPPQNARVRVVAPRPTTPERQAIHTVLSAALDELRVQTSPSEIRDRCSLPFTLRLSLASRNLARVDLLLEAGGNDKASDRHLSRLRLTCRASRTAAAR